MDICAAKFKLAEKYCLERNSGIVVGKFVKLAEKDWFGRNLWIVAIKLLKKDWFKRNCWQVKKGNKLKD